MISCPERIASHSMVATPPVRLRYTQSELADAVPFHAVERAVVERRRTETDVAQGRMREVHDSRFQHPPGIISIPTTQAVMPLSDGHSAAPLRLPI